MSSVIYKLRKCEFCDKDFSMNTFAKYYIFKKATHEKTLYFCGHSCLIKYEEKAKKEKINKKERNEK